MLLGCTPHRFKHSGMPQFEPVPTGTIRAAAATPSISWPKAALTSADGKPLVKTLPMFCVPASSLLRAETSWAFSQPGVEMLR